MANVIKTVITYPLNGSTRDFNIPFEYLARKFIQVTLIGRDRKPLTNIDDYRFTSKNQITTNRAWGTGDGYQLIELRRFTSATERLVDFSDGSILRAYDLNVSQIQTLHVAEEARDLTADTIGVNSDGDLDARGRRIVNLADPVNDMDAVNLKTIKEWNDGAYQSYIKAKQEASKAEGYRNDTYRYMQSAEASKNSAALSESNAKTSEDNARYWRDGAQLSENSAKASASEAKVSESNSKESELSSKSDADRSYREAERAKGYADAMGHAIDLGSTIESMDGYHIGWKGNHSWLGSARVVDNQKNPSKAISLDCWPGDQNLPSISIQDVMGQPRFYLFPKDQSGYLVTDNYLKASVQWDDSNKTTTIRSRAPVGTPTSALVVGNDTFAYWSESQQRYLFSMGNAGNITNVHSVNYNQTGSNYSTFLGYKMGPNGVATGGVEWSTTPDGHPLGITFWNDFNGSRQSNVNIVLNEGTGTLATREWVNSQGFVKTSGTKLGPVVTGKLVGIQGSGNVVTVGGFEAMMSQVPDNAVFCGVVFGQSGSFRAGAPKWRVIS